MELRRILGYLAHKAADGFVTLAFLAFFAFWIAYAAISWPASTPQGEVPGGKFSQYFANMFGDCPAGQYLQGFWADGTKHCGSLTVPSAPAPSGVGGANLPKFTNQRWNDSNGQNHLWTTTDTDSLSWSCNGPAQKNKSSEDLNHPQYSLTWAQLNANGWTNGDYVCTWTAVWPGGSSTFSESFHIGPPAPSVSVSRSADSNGITTSWSTNDATSLNWSCSGPTSQGGSTSLSQTPYYTDWASFHSSWWPAGSYGCTWTATWPGGTKTYSESFTIK